MMDNVRRAPYHELSSHGFSIARVRERLIVYETWHHCLSLAVLFACWGALQPLGGHSDLLDNCFFFCNLDVM